MQLTEKNNEPDWVALCRKGDNSAFTALYNKYAKRVFNSICRVIPHTAEAEDILQESFYHAFSDIHRLQNPSSFGAWVSRIAINRAISHLRRQKVSFLDADEIEVADEPPEDEETAQLFECTVDEVRNAICQLPTGYRTILSLYLFEDMNQEEIARMLGVSHSTVRTQYHRAKKKVLQLLKNKTWS